VLEATDLNHAIQLMSKHPGVKAGPFEIRPAADLRSVKVHSDVQQAQEVNPRRLRHVAPSPNDQSFDSNTGTKAIRPHQNQKASR
jgi:hypothetical protein